MVFRCNSSFAALHWSGFTVDDVKSAEEKGLWFIVAVTFLLNTNYKVTPVNSALLYELQTMHMAMGSGTYTTSSSIMTDPWHHLYPQSYHQGLYKVPYVSGNLMTHQWAALYSLRAPYSHWLRVYTWDLQAMRSRPEKDLWTHPPSYLSNPLQDKQRCTILDFNDNQWAFLAIHPFYSFLHLPIYIQLAIGQDTDV